LAEGVKSKEIGTLCQATGGKGTRQCGGGWEGRAPLWVDGGKGNGSEPYQGGEDPRRLKKKKIAGGGKGGGGELAFLSRQFQKEIQTPLAEKKKKGGKIGVAK